MPQKNLASLFYDMFSGVYKQSLSPEQNERFEANANKIKKILEDLTEQKAIEVCARLGEATKVAFEEIGKDIEALENATKKSRF